MLKEQIEKDFISAMKEQNETKISTFRMLKSALQNMEIQKKKELSDDEIIQIIQSQIKSRTDSINMYKKGDRPELAENEVREIEILKTYLGQQLSETEIRPKVQEIIRELQAQSRQDMGKVMGRANEIFKGKADMSLVARITQEILNQ